MAYRVIVQFADLEDKRHIYHVGDTYPRSGSAPTKERIMFLLSNQNLLQKPVIEEVTDFDGALNKPVEQGTEEKQVSVEAAKTALKQSEAAEVKEYKPKRTRRSKKAENG